MLHSRPVSGFTLIEMMMAIGLGIVLVYTALAGFRVASQSMTIANRLSLENSLMRAGFAEAHNQLDFWTNLDDPYDSTRQRLRKSDTDVGGQGWAYEFKGGQYPSTRIGLPFSPMRDDFPANTDPRLGGTSAGSSVPRSAGSSGTGIVQVPPLPLGVATPMINPYESDTGFDPTYAWAPHDPRTWFRGNCIEKYRPSSSKEPSAPSLWFGRYGIFTNVSTAPTFKPYTGLKPLPSDPGGSAYNTTFPALAGTFPVHFWYGRQLLGLSRALGFYGFCDYLPSNALWGYYASQNSSYTNDGGLANLFTREYNNGGGGPFTFAGEGMGPTTLGSYALTNAQSFGITNPYNRTVDDQTFAWEHYRYYKTDYPVSWGGQAAQLQSFIANTLPLTALMAQRPQHWPVVLVGVGHFLKSGHFVNIAKIRWTSTMTGEVVELSFTGVGSTLRGARMQRKRPDVGAGWAKWDNTASATNDPNLDTP